MRSSLQQQGYDPCACCSVDEADALAALVVREMPGTGKIDLDTRLG